MSEVIEKAANINFMTDNMIDKISELRDKYDAAQATNDSSLIYALYSLVFLLVINLLS